MNIMHLHRGHLGVAVILSAFLCSCEDFLDIREDEPEPAKVSNMIDAWPFIEEDLYYATDNLPETQVDVGRPTKYAAMAVLARVHLFQGEYTAAAILLDSIIQSHRYRFVNSYHDNYRIATNNNAESIFEIQYAVNDGTPESFNGGYGDCLNFPQGGDIGICCRKKQEPGVNRSLSGCVNSQRGCFPGRHIPGRSLPLCA